MTAPLRDPARLRAFADSRWSALTGGQPVGDEEIAAMTEAMFRLAVHPKSTRADSVDLLYRAHRADPADARFAHHLGRMALEDGRLGEAEAWLSEAHQTEPESHRIATHLIVALRRLEQDQPVEAAGARADYRSRSRDLSKTIRAAGAAGCGWAGFYDLEMSETLPVEVSDQAYEELLPTLRAIRDLSDRPGGVRAFAAAAVAWLVRGYPLEDVRDLADGLPATDYRASYLLTLVCRLFAQPVAELPPRLAQAVSRRELPDILVALIHQRRLLADVRAYPQLGALRAAQWFLTDEHPHRPDTQHVSVLDAATAALRTPPPAFVRGLGATGPDRAAAADAEARLKTLQVTLGTLDADRTALTEFIGGPLKTAGLNAVTDEERATVAADQALLSRALDRLIATAAEAHEDAKRLLGDIGHLGTAELGDDFGERADAVHIALADRMAPGKIRRLLSRIRNARAGAAGTAPSPAAEALAARLGEEADEPETDTPEEVSPTDVAAALARAHRAVADIFTAAEQSLRPYPDSTALRHLRNLVLGRLAENQYRMGRTLPARRTWHRLLADSGPSAAVFRNIAVAALGDGDQRHATEMWRQYANELYRSAGRDAERDHLHAVLAEAYLPPGLRHDDPTESAHTVHFLASARAIRAATVHLRLRGLDPAVADERRRPAIEQAITFKQRVHRALSAEKQWPLGTTAVVIIGNLALVDELPLDPEDGLTFQTALAAGIGDPAEGLALLNSLRDRAVGIARRRIAADIARQDESTLPARYRALVAAWVRSSVPEADSYWLDWARDLYDPRTLATVTAADKNRRRSGGGPELTAAQQELHKWCRLIPSATGPYRDLARLTEQSGDVEGAWHLLLRATRYGVHPIGLRLAAHDLTRIGWKQRRYSDVIPPVTDVLERAPDESMWKLVEDVHVGVKVDLLNRRLPASKVVRRFARWYEERAAHREPEFRDAAAEVLQHLRTRPS